MKTNYKFYKDHRFLVVDDDPRLRDHAVSVLVDIGFSKDAILTADSGKHAIEVLKQPGVDVEFFVIDLVMPEMNGIELLKILSKNKKYQSTPKLVLSSEIDSNIILNAVSAGANSYLNKPCEKLSLAKKLFECVSK